MIPTCPAFELRGIILAFASVIGTTVAAIMLQWLKQVVSNIQDVHQQNADTDAERVRKM